MNIQVAYQRLRNTLMHLNPKYLLKRLIALKNHILIQLEQLCIQQNRINEELRSTNAVLLHALIHIMNVQERQSRLNSEQYVRLSRKIEQLERMYRESVNSRITNTQS